MTKSYLKYIVINLLLTFGCFLAEAFEPVKSEGISAEAQAIINNYSPLDRYVTKEQFQKIVKDIETKKMAQQIIVVDTRDQAGCLKMYRHLLAMGWPAHANMCDHDANNPYMSLMLGSEVTEESLTPVQKAFQDNPDLFKKSGPSDRRKALYERTRNIAVLSGGIVAAFAAQEEEESGWDMQGLKDNGVENQVKKHWREGPVQDQDGPFVNFVLHPIAGSIYYQAARISGYGKRQSFGYSFFMSLLFWEYGVESVFETPSWNDIWATPIIGSLIGELFLKLYNDIEAHDGQVMGSSKLGFVAKMFLNSAETLRPYINKIFKSRFIKEGKTSITAAKCDDTQPQETVDRGDQYCPFLLYEFKF